MWWYQEQPFEFHILRELQTMMYKKRNEGKSGNESKSIEIGRQTMYVMTQKPADQRRRKRL